MSSHSSALVDSGSLACRAVLLSGWLTNKAPRGKTTFMKRHPARNTRPEILEGASLQYAPENEFGVVFLFAKLARKWRLVVEKIRAAFPDCVAYQKVGGKDKRVLIEFEFRSKSAKLHGHDLKKCDWIVCWEHNWPQIPKHLQVIELKREFGLGLNVWVMAVDGPYKEILSRAKSNANWTVPGRAHVGDLLVFYHRHPDRCIKDIFRVNGPSREERAHFHKNVNYYRSLPGKANTKRKYDVFAPIKRVCALRSPIFWEDLKRDKFLKTAGFVRAQMQGRPMATEHWPFLYDLIIRRNPSVVQKLSKYDPEKL